MADFLARLSLSINSVLPAGYHVEPNRRPDLGELHHASDAEAQRFFNEHFPEQDELHGGSVTLMAERVSVGTPTPFAARRADEPDVLFFAPPGCEHASGSYVHYFFDEDADAGYFCDSSARLETAAVHVLDELQDSVSEATREPWPNQGMAEVPHVSSSTEGTHLRLWFEDSGGVVLELPQVSLSAES